MYAVTVANAVFAFGLNIHGVVASPQYQLSLYGHPNANPFIFGEVQHPTALAPLVDISYFDGVSYNIMAQESLATDIHAGAAVLQLTEIVNTSVRLDMTWPGEPYSAFQTTTLYQGAVELHLDIRRVDVDVDWVCVIGW